MSEYQVYEFITLDRSLTRREMAALRAISTRAEISPTRFWNEYHWGDLKADPAKLLMKYFDAHLYQANFGTRRLMLRLPAAKVDPRQLAAYFPGGPAVLKKAGAFVAIDLVCDSEDARWEDDEDVASLATLVPLRGELLRGDLRAAYVAWLSAVGAGEIDDDVEEPPVPAGFGQPSAALSALIEFLRVDQDLLNAAIEGRPACQTTARP